MTTQAQEIEQIAREMAKGKHLPWHLFVPDATEEFLRRIHTAEALEMEIVPDDAPRSEG
jgi:hypothetical protein